MRNWIKETRDALHRGHQFVTRDIWHVGAKGEPLPEGIIIKQIRAIILLARSLADETFMLRAAALTFATLLFIVPFVILMFGIINTFDLGNHVYDAVNDRMNSYLTTVAEKVSDILPEEQESDTPTPSGEPQEIEPGTPTPPEVEPVASVETDDTNFEESPATADPVESDNITETEAIDKQKKIAHSKDLLKELLTIFFPIFREGKGSNPINELVEMAANGAASPRALAIMGIVFLLSTVLGFMRNMESAFNRIWGVQKNRSIYHTISGYLLITLLLPFVATAVLAVSAALQNEAIVSSLGPLAFTLKVGQYLLVSTAFTILYFFVPNTRVKLRYASLGGFVAGGLWIVMASVYFKFQFSQDNYSSFFSSAIEFIPLFLMWIYVSWLILLFGTLVSFAYQNEKTFAMECLSDNPSFAYREALAVRVAIETVRRFNEGIPPLSVHQIAESWNVPTRLLNETFEHLAEHGLMVMCATEPVTYQPARSPESTTLKDVLTALRCEGMDPSFLLDEERFQTLYGALEAGGKKLRHRSLTELAALYDPLTTDEKESAQKEDELFDEALLP